MSLASALKVLKQTPVVVPGADTAAGVGAEFFVRFPDRAATTPAAA